MRNKQTLVKKKNASLHQKPIVIRSTEQKIVGFVAPKSDGWGRVAGFSELSPQTQSAVKKVSFQQLTESQKPQPAADNGTACIPSETPADLSNWWILDFLAVIFFSWPRAV